MNPEKLKEHREVLPTAMRDLRTRLGIPLAYYDDKQTARRWSPPKDGSVI
jgi:hypothetical protein